MTRGCHATNHQSESTMGGTTQGIELDGMIKIPQAAAQTDASRNSFWSRPITKKRGNKKNVRLVKGMFHQLCDEIQHCLIEVGVKGPH